MAVFMKLGDFKNIPHPGTVEFSMEFEKIKVTLMDPKAQAALQQKGFSRAGITELTNSKGLSNEKDRKLVAMIMASLVG